MRRYSKDLTHMTTFRLSDNLRSEAEQCADFQGISFSAFVRQSLLRNIFVSRGVEEEVVRRTTAITTGRAQ